MMYIDLNTDYVLLNGRVADMRNLKYVEDPKILEAMTLNLQQYLRNNHLNEDVGVASQTLSTLAGYGADLLSWGIPKVLSYLKELLPDTIEGWVHLGVDTISLILDVIGPFTGGLGNAASMVIDIVHGIYYIGASQGWPGFPDHKDKEFEYLLTGFITLGFAAVPIGGNAGSIGFKAYLRKFPIGKNVVEWLEKLFKSSIGKGIKGIFEWIFKKAGGLGKFFYAMFEKMTHIPFIGGMFKWIGKQLKSGIAKISSGLDDLLIKLFNKPGMKQWAEKNMGKEFSQHANKVLGQHITDKTGKAVAAKAVTDELGGKAVKSAANAYLKDLPMYRSIAGKIKMMITQDLADKVDVTKTYRMLWELLGGAKLAKDATNLSFFKKNGLISEKDQTKYNDWFLKYSYFLPDADRDDNELSQQDVKNIQKFLNDNSELYSAKNPPSETGEIDAKTIGSMRELLQYFKDQDTSQFSEDDKTQADKLKQFCDDGLNELNKLDKGLFDKLKDMAPQIKKTSENYLTDFKHFVV